MKITTDKIKFEYKLPINIRGKLLQQTEIGKITISTNQNEFNYFFTSFDNFHKNDLDDKLIFLKENALKINNHDNPEYDFLLNSLSLNYQNKIENNLNINVNYLYIPKQNDSQNDLQDTLKIKINPTQVNEKEFLRQLKIILSNPKINRIRFDGNQLFSLKEITNFVSNFNESEKSKIEYFEEPCTDIYESITFSNQIKIPLAIDENIHLLSELITSLNLKPIIVIKPQLFGYNQSLKMINENSKKQIRTVISSCYELEQDLKTLLKVADFSNQANKNSEFHGLDTVKFIDSSTIIQKMNKLSLCN